MPSVLVVHHTPSPAMQSMLEAVLDGTRSEGLEDVAVVVRPALAATASDLLAADGFVLGTPVNIGYVSGALKHFLDQVYYPCLTAKVGAPYAAYLHGNDDVTGALRALESIARGMGWERVAAPVTVTGGLDRTDREACAELGATVSAVAAGL
ncbi:flavodoxin family protein [Thalassiella azotivora]